MWFLCSLPLITAGAASSALYDTVVHSLRKREEDIFSRYLITLKKELLPSIPSALLWEAVTAGNFLLLRAYAGSAGTSRNAYIAAIALIILDIFVLGTACWVFPIQSRFTFNFTGLNGTAIRLAIASAPRTLLLGLLTAASVWLSIRFLVPVMLLPSLNALLSSFLIEPVFRKYT